MRQINGAPDSAGGIELDAAGRGLICMVVAAAKP
jgi:hypothetical protein